MVMIFMWPLHYQMAQPDRGDFHSKTDAVSPAKEALRLAVMCRGA